jgi:cytochrome bd-type quinol oxidase subunit 2
MPEVPENSETPASSKAPERTRRSGPGRILITVYAVFAVAATSRAGLQIAIQFSEAPVAYLLSAFAAVVYILATVMLARSGRLSHRIAVISCSVELVGVLVVGTLSVLDRAAFPDATVWSGYGKGYGFVPLVLPVLGLLWLRHVSPDTDTDTDTNTETAAGPDGPTSSAT